MHSGLIWSPLSTRKAANLTLSIHLLISFHNRSNVGPLLYQCSGGLFAFFGIDGDWGLTFCRGYLLGTRGTHWAARKILFCSSLGTVSGFWWWWRWWDGQRWSELGWWWRWWWGRGGGVVRREQAMVHFVASQRLLSGLQWIHSSALLQCVELCYSVLNCVTPCFTVLQYFWSYWSVLQCVGSIELFGVL